MRPSAGAATSVPLVVFGALLVTAPLLAGADEARIERVDGLAGQSFSRRPHLVEVADQGVLAAPGRDLETGNLQAVMGGQAVGRQDRLQNLCPTQPGSQPIRRGRRAGFSPMTRRAWKSAG